MGGGRGEPRAPPRAPSRRPRPAPRARAVYGRDWGFQPTGAGPLASRGRPLQAAVSLHSFLFQALLLLGAAQRPKWDHIFVLALDGRDGVLGQLKCLVFKNHKSIARHPMWVKINPKQKTCLPQGPRGLRLAGGCSQRTPRPAPGERGMPRLTQCGGGGLPCPRCDIKQQEGALRGDAHVTTAVVGSSQWSRPDWAQVSPEGLPWGSGGGQDTPGVTTCGSAHVLGAGPPGAPSPRQRAGGTPRGRSGWGWETPRGRWRPKRGNRSRLPRG